MLGITRQPNQNNDWVALPNIKKLCLECIE